MSATDTMRLFDMLTAEGSLSVDLPLAWARPAEAVRVDLERREVLGWHATVRDGDEQVLDLAWHDDVDELLLTGGDLPVPAPDDEWDSLDQCYWGIVRRHGDDLYVAEVDSDALEARHCGSPRLMRPGHVCAGDVEVLWHRVPVPDWDEAWAQARQYFEDLRTAAP